MSRRRKREQTELTFECLVPLRPPAEVVDLGVVRAVMRRVRGADLGYAVKLATSSGRETKP